MWGKNDGHASLKYILPSMISEKMTSAQIIMVNVQLRKFLFLTEIAVDLNNKNIPMSAGRIIQRIASLFTYDSLMVV
jgi:hypothetical protein